MTELEEMLEALAAACQESNHWLRDRALQQEFPLMPMTEFLSEGGTVSPERKAATYAFGYRIQLTREGTRRRVALGAYYRGPDGDVQPPLVSELSDDVVAAVRTLADRAEPAYGRARLRHVLFERNVDDRREQAQLAVRAYIESAGDRANSIEAGEDLQVALRLARAVGDDGLAVAAMAAMLAAAREALVDESPKPGVTLRLLDPLADEPRAPAELDEVLAAAFDTYTDPWNREHVLKLQVRRAAAGPDRDALISAGVEIWLDAAASSEGLARALHLKEALTRAEASGRPDLVQRAAASLQTIDKEELDLVAISAQIAASPSEIEEVFAPIIQAATWQEALAAFASFGPLCRTVEQNREQVARDAQQFVFRQLFATERLGGDGLPRFQATTPDQKAEFELATLETQYLTMWAPMLADALTEVRNRHGLPSVTQLAEFFELRPVVTPGLGRALARVMTRFWLGDHEGAAFTAALRVETLVRLLALQTGAGIYRLQRLDKPGQYPGLGALLPVLLSNGLDPNWHRFIYTLCANAAGWNLRNEIGHGFVDDVDAPVAALLIQAVVYLTTLHATPTSPDDAADD